MTRKLLLLLLVLLVGCAGFGLDNDRATVVLVRSLANEIGCEVARGDNAGLDRALRNLYDFVKLGAIPQDAIDYLTEEMGKAFKDRPTLGLQIANLAELMGVTFDSAGMLIGLETVPSEMLQAAAGGYDMGFKICLP